MVTHTERRLLALGALCSLCALQFHGATASQKIMTQMTKSFMGALNDCKNELNLGDQIMTDLIHFWKEEYELVHRDVGCAISCIASKLNLLTDDFTMHHENAKEFAVSHGADEDVATQLVTMIHDCEKLHLGINDECRRVLEISKCFRTKIHELKWAPSMEVILEEIMTEFKEV